MKAGYAISARDGTGFTWDGRTANGQAARSGVYLVPVASGGTVATRRIVKVE